MNTQLRWVPILTTAATMLAVVRSLAGSLDPTNAPGPTMHTLEDIYQKVANLAPQDLQQLLASTTAMGAGYYAGTTLDAVDGDLAAGNIRAGVTVFGIIGDPNVVHTGSGDAGAGDLLAGRKAWVDGTEVTGTIPTRSLSASTTTMAGGYYLATTLDAVDGDLAAGNIRAGVTLFGIIGDPNVVDTGSGDAGAGDLLAGRKAWVDGTEVTGTIPTRSLSANTTTMAGGYYLATTLDAVDVDMTAGNIKKDVVLFGITGTYEGGGGGALAAAVPRTGQTVSHLSGDDGDLQKGVVWPSPRFTDHGDGTVTDNLTGLMWTKSGNVPATKLHWTNAVVYCVNMNSGAGTYGHTDWRLPNVRELCSLLDYGRLWPALPAGHPFSNVANDDYWAGTTYAGAADAAWNVMMGTGEAYHYDSKTNTKYVWPVRGP